MSKTINPKEVNSTTVTVALIMWSVFEDQKMECNQYHSSYFYRNKEPVEWLKN